MIMILPLVVLATGAVLAGYLNWPTEALAKFLGQSPSLALGYKVATSAGYATPVPAALWGHEVAGEHPPLFTWAMLIGAAASLAGIRVAFVLHLKERGRAEEIAARFAPLTRVLENKYWVDELYDQIIVRPLWALGEMFAWFDNNVVDNFMTVLGLLPQVPAWLLRYGTQRGYLQGYAAAMVLGIAVILLFIFL
jgi:NADH-quinone oxidoreductase subunit L